MEKIVTKGGEYCIGLKGNQGSLHEDAALYFGDEDLLSACSYMSVWEKAGGGIEQREYRLNTDISWLSQRAEWASL